MAPTFASWADLRNAIDNNKNRHCSLPHQKQTTNICIESQPDWLKDVKGFTVLTESIPAHPLAISASLGDPLFRYSNNATQTAAMRTLLADLSLRFDDIYKENSGRSRGWIKKDFVAWFLKTQSLDKWLWAYEAVLSDKMSSAVCDFIALTIEPKTTIAVFFPTQKRVACYPTGATIHDRIICLDGTTGNWITPASGLVASSREFYTLTTNLGWKWIAPASVSISESVAELKEQIKKVEGTTLPTLTKHELKGWIWRQAFQAQFKN